VFLWIWVTGAPKERRPAIADAAAVIAGAGLDFLAVAPVERRSSTPKRPRARF
jgi:hypothetical protein